MCINRWTETKRGRIKWHSGAEMIPNVSQRGTSRDPAPDSAAFLLLYLLIYSFIHSFLGDFCIISYRSNCCIVPVGTGQKRMNIDEVSQSCSAFSFKSLGKHLLGWKKPQLCRGFFWHGPFIWGRHFWHGIFLHVVLHITVYSNFKGAICGYLAY